MCYYIYRSRYMAARNRIFQKATELLLLKGHLNQDDLIHHYNVTSEKITQAMEKHHQKKLEGKILVLLMV